MEQAGESDREPRLDEPRDDEDREGPVSLGDEDRLALVLAYLGPLCLVPLLGRGHDPFVRWHARQGLGLAVVAAATIIALYPLDWLFSLAGELLWRLYFAIELLIGLGFLLVTSLAIERALAGRKLRIPWLAELADHD